MCQIDIRKSEAWRIYRTTTRNWHQIWVWFRVPMKDLRVWIKIFAAISDWFSKQKKVPLWLCQIDVRKSFGWQIYRTTTWNWHQICIWIWSNFKKFRVKIEIISTSFDWISKQEVKLLLFLSNWYCRKLGLTDLPGYEKKLISDMNLILSFYERS